MILRQYYLGCVAHASYPIADQVAGAAMVVDPQRDIEQYLADAEELRCTIGHVFLTHMHADFIAGHLELRDRVGARIHLGAQASAEYAFVPMADGDEVRLGDARISVMQTPGHSPESISILVFDPEGGDESPHAALTGDTLFIGDVDETLVYPAHGAGSLCGKHLSTDTVSTIGEQRNYNYALQPMSRERFIEIVTADQPDTPAYFTYDAVLNSRERPTLDDTLARELRPLTLQQLLGLLRDGAQLLDTREPADFEGAHMRGAQQLGDTPEHVQRTERIIAGAVAEQLAAPAPPLLVDVRTAREWGEGHIDEALNLPLSQLSEGLQELPLDRPLVVHCASGYRSAIAVSLLRREGLPHVSNLVGGLAAWTSAQLPTVP